MKTENEYRGCSQYREVIRERIESLNKFEARGGGDLFSDLKVGKLLAAYRVELGRLASGRPDVYEDHEPIIRGLLLADKVWQYFEDANKRRPDILNGYLPNGKPANYAEWVYQLVFEAKEQFNTSLRSLESNLRRQEDNKR